MSATTTIHEQSMVKIYNDFIFTLTIEAPCFNSWNIPTPASYANELYVIDLLTQPVLTITWTADSN